MDEAHLGSSDLEDCEDVWAEELSDYILETQKRQNEVEKWFEANVLVSKLVSSIAPYDDGALNKGTQLDGRAIHVAPLCIQNSPHASALPDPGPCCGG